MLRRPADPFLSRRSTPLSQMKHPNKGVQEEVGKVAFPIMHFKRIHCFEQASPFSSNVPTRSPSPCTRKKPQQGEQPKSRSPDPSKPRKQVVKEVDETPIGAKTGENKKDLPQAPKELSNKNGQLVSKPGTATQPKPAQPGDVQRRDGPSPKPFASPPQASQASQARQASQASQAAGQAASQTASQTASQAARPPKDDKTAKSTHSTSTQSMRAASSASPRQPGASPQPGARPVEQIRPPGQDSHVKGPVPPTSHEREPQTQRPRPTPSSNTQQDPTPVGGRQPSPAGSSSTAQKALISQCGVGAPDASSHQSQQNQSSAVARTDKNLQADAKGTLLLKDTPTTEGARAPVKQAATHPVAKPQMRREPRASFYTVQKTDKTQIQPDREELPSLPVLPSKGGVYPLPGQHSTAPPLSQQYASALARRLHPAPSELSTRPSPGVPSPPLPASSSGLPPSDGQEKTVSGVQSQGSLPPPKADPVSSSSAPVASKNGPTQGAQSSASRPPGSHAPDEDEYEDYSGYSGSSRSSSASHDEAEHDEGGKHSHSDCSSLSDGARSRSPSSGRQCGNDFLPDISTQVRAAKPRDQDRSHANRADDLCEFHVMDDEDVQDAMQDMQGTSLHQEYDQTLRRLGARRAPAPAQGLQRQVTHWTGWTLNMYNMLNAAALRVPLSKHVAPIITLFHCDSLFFSGGMCLTFLKPAAAWVQKATVQKSHNMCSSDMVHTCEMFFVLLLRCFLKVLRFASGCCISDAARPQPFQALRCAQPLFKGCSNRRKLCWFCRQCSPGAEELAWWALRAMDIAGYEVVSFWQDGHSCKFSFWFWSGKPSEQAIGRWNGSIQHDLIASYSHTSTAAAAAASINQLPFDLGQAFLEAWPGIDSLKEKIQSIHWHFWILCIVTLACLFHWGQVVWDML